MAPSPTFRRFMATTSTMALGGTVLVGFGCDLWRDRCDLWIVAGLLGILALVLYPGVVRQCLRDVARKESIKERKAG